MSIISISQKKIFLVQSSGQVTDVPTSVRVLGEGVISIWIDPSRVEEHYGEIPIYGVVADEREFGPGGPGSHRR
ncbi:MAG TPA: hypothetical protein VHF08_06480 [Nitrososphaeraceae archaeon]|nr:hypothetical protein [Nitrososphaeraceae archaeon]